jgi:hypothetical protein
LPSSAFAFEGFETERRINMKLLKYTCMAMLLTAAFAFTSVVTQAQEPEMAPDEACAEAASVSVLPLAAAAFFGIPSAFVLARRRRTTKK